MSGTGDHFVRFGTHALREADKWVSTDAATGDTAPPMDQVLETIDQLSDHFGRYQSVCCTGVHAGYRLADRLCRSMLEVEVDATSIPMLEGGRRRWC